MTKARARERAKARAAKSVRKDHNSDLSEQTEEQKQDNHFDRKANSIKGPSMNANHGNFGGARRGAARSN
ncbi:hypothetical protein WH96_13245 [Kiloniella spongiae]|uniref:Uncharacterized protein n=1 Tax=Kiloniella spongiae TaxID=1489064 RepID=A0A0H2MC74_9PROT|nr:hypothetical protein [Kiloniella spongiae]KLN60149.1 hypothetical protein WH96_13245 [Kiloniella spongiae]